jgi:hypothetical protein
LSKDCNNVALVREKFAALGGNLSIEVVDPEIGISPALLKQAI